MDADRRILVVDDDVVSRKFAQTLLWQKGFSVQTAHDGKVALDIHEKEDFDIILMDIQMPSLNGFTVTALIRQREADLGRHTPIIAMTAYALKGDRERCLEAGMDDYISKPVNTGELFEKLDLWLSRT
jgi:two-component system sensor histidine kinase/response regulator